MIDDHLGWPHSPPTPVPAGARIPSQAGRVIDLVAYETRRDRVPVLRSGAFLPEPPGDEERFQYFGQVPRWIFVLLFLAQCGVLYGFVMVMTKSLHTALLLSLLTFTIPPMVVNVWLRTRRHRTVLAEHLLKVRLWPYENPVPPSVDVFVPVCGEPHEVLDNTFQHLAALEWSGRLRVHVLDDAADPQVGVLARGYGFHYVVRPNRGEWKKAGNLIHAFDQTDGDLIAVFDADFVPRPDFLQHTVPYMDDPVVGVVQTAQYFDCDPANVNDFARYAGALQELFFRWTQPSRDVYEAAICAGTNVVYRREAVVAAGGYAKVPLGEDVHSGVKIWVADYRTRYVPLVLAKGLAPDTWKGLTNQQYRWCRSSMLIMISEIFRRAPFGARQRVCYWAAFLYYMASATLPLTQVLPGLLMLWFHPDEIHLWNYLPMLPSLLGPFLLWPRLARGWDIGIYRVTIVNAFCHLLAVMHALRQHVEAWVPTGAADAQAAASKGAGRRKPDVPRRIALMLRTWFVVTQGLLWAGIARAVLESPTTGALVYVPAALLSVLQVWLLGPLLVHLEARRPRSSRRRTPAKHASRTPRRKSPAAPAPAVALTA